MAVSEMDYINRGGGLIKASSWSDAVSKAKSYIIIQANHGSGVKLFNTMPKEAIPSTGTILSTFGNFIGGVGNAWVRFEASITTSTVNFYVDTSSSSGTVSYYYDI